MVLYDIRVIFRWVGETCLIFSILILIHVLSVQSLYALDVIKIGKPQSSKDVREIYNYELLKTVLKKTESDFGSFEIVYVTSMMRNRGLAELIEGKDLNVFIAPTQTEWEEKAIPVYFPLRKGLLGYRLFLIKKSSKEKIKRLKTIEDLKKLRAGFAAQWSIVKVLKPLGFNIVLGNNYEGLFKMLNSGRFDYFPRGIDEIFPEYGMRKEVFPEMIIESTKCLYIPLPIYFFVSPKKPVIAKRIEKGLWRMLKDGSFDRLFLKYFKNSIARATLKKRKIFSIDNPKLIKNEIFNKKELWINPKAILN